MKSASLEVGCLALTLAPTTEREEELEWSELLEELESSADDVHDALRRKENIRILAGPEVESGQGSFNFFPIQIFEDYKSEPHVIQVASLLEPLVLNITIPRRLHPEYLSSLDEEDEGDPEEFFVLYDGFIFLVLSEQDRLYAPIKSGHLIRRYLEREVFSALEYLTPEVVGPSPAHPDWIITSQKRKSDETDNVESLPFRKVHFIDEPAEIDPAELLQSVYWLHGLRWQRFYRLVCLKNVTMWYSSRMFSDYIDMFKSHKEILTLSTHSFRLRSEARAKRQQALLSFYQNLADYTALTSDISEQKTEFMQDIAESKFLQDFGDYWESTLQFSPPPLHNLMNGVEFLTQSKISQRRDSVILWSSMIGAIVGALITLVVTMLA